MIWWTKSWNPVLGCTKCSPACENCYAEALHTQRHKALLAGKKQAECYRKPFGQVQFLPERLEQPLHWKKPQRIFVGNMGDLFHEDVAGGWLDAIFTFMALCPQHTFMLLTKRPERMAKYINRFRKGEDWADHLADWADYLLGQEAECAVANSINEQLHEPFNVGWPMRNLWLGTTIWDQPSADRNLSDLFDTPAAHYFVSYEPARGPVDFTRVRTPAGVTFDALADHADSEGPALNWGVFGGETGANARPSHPDWFRSARDQFLAAGVPFMFKQWGEWGDMPWRVFAEKCGAITPDGQTYSPDAAAFNGEELPEGSSLRCRVGSRRAGRVLDGRTWEEVPNG